MGYKTCKRIQTLEEKGIKPVNIGSQKEKSFKKKSCRKVTMKVRSKVMRDKSRCADFMPDKSRFSKRKSRRKKTKKHQIKCG